MNLSGKYIRGSGAYEVKEVAPIVESGELYVNRDFSTGDLTGWTDASGKYSVVNYQGVYSSSVAAYEMLMQLGRLTIGRWYKMTVNIINDDDSMLMVMLNDWTNYKGITSTGTGYKEWIFKATHADSGLACHPQGAAKTLIFDNFSMEELPAGYPLIDKGDKYLECTSAGTIAFASDQAYGEWEFDCYKNLDVNRPGIQFICSDVDVYTEVTGYGFLFDDAEGLYIEKYDGAGTADVLLGTAASYIKIGIWYRIKITRTLDGVFTAFVKGGGFGETKWTLLTTTLGSNPTAADLTYVTSKYLVLDFDIGDRIANIIMKKGVIQ